jgi:hypothetical protein
MDPNAALAEIRRLNEEHANYGELSAGKTARLIELVEGLDNWLSGNGFLPEAWAGGHSQAGDF